MRSCVLLFIVAFTARYNVMVAEAYCGLGGCDCSSEPYVTCCSGFTCGRQGRCEEIEALLVHALLNNTCGDSYLRQLRIQVTLRDEFLYPYPYNFNNYGYTESGVPGYEGPRYAPNYGYAGGSAAFGNNYVGYNYGVGKVPYSEFFFAGF